MKSLQLAPLFMVMVASQAAAAQDLLLPTTVAREIKRETTETYEVNSTGAGELIAATFETRAISGTIGIFDAAGTKLRTFTVWQGRMRVGFVSPGLGLYQIRVAVTPSEGTGAYSMTLDRHFPSARLNGHHVHPRHEYQGKRIAQLIADIEKGVTNAEERFWAELATLRAPIVEDVAVDEQHVLVTFLWKEVYETHNVLFQWPPAFSRADDYYMTHIPGTRIWYKTIRVRRGARFNYWFSPNDVPEDRDITAHYDPLNPRRGYDDDDNNYSLFELAGAPDERWIRNTPTLRGNIEKATFESTLLKGVRNIWIYTPPGYTADAAPYPLIIMFNGMMYVGSGVASTVVDNLVAEHKIRAPVICFIAQMPPQPEMVSGQFADAIAHELLSRLRSTHRISSRAQDILLGGFSAGGVWAAYIALKHSSLFGNVFSQSGSFRFRLPADSEPNSLSAMYVKAPRLPIRFYMDSGLYEPFPAAQRPVDEIALDESNTAGNRHFRDVLRAKGYDVTYRETGGGHEQLHWRATLPEALIALLPPP